MIVEPVVIALHASHAQTISCGEPRNVEIDDVFVDTCIGRVG
ncbi:MAG TPA: hypothetical protein VFI01_12460 [Gaiellaceae bacterium]|nr:hypothetical protein [Gaiellaceae bacterium]